MKIEHETSSKKEGSEKGIPEEERRIAGAIDVYMMNLGIILAGVVVGWNTSLQIGIGEYLISLALCSMGYLCLALCISEMAGAVAFSGGSFGYARCTLSPFLGYLVGIFDLLQSVICTALFVDVIAKAFNIAIQGTAEFLPLWWFAVYVILIAIATPGGRIFWNSVYAVTFLTIILMCIYGFGCMDRLNFSKYATIEVPAFNGSTHEFVNNLLVPTVCFIGVDLITLFGEETKDPQKNIPRGMTPAMITTIVFAWWMTLTCVSMKPGVSEELMSTDILFPLHFGFEELFNTDHHVAHFLMGLTIFSSAVGFMFAAGRQMYSMAKSGLLPAFLGQTYGRQKSPVIAMCFVAFLGFVVLLPVWGINPGADDLYEVCIIGACFVYLGMFWCFLVFKYRFESLERTFVNPLGTFSAIYGIVYFSTVVLSILFVQLDFNALYAITPYVIIAVIYYFKVVESRQFFSKDEQAKFMKAYILNANRRRKKTPPSKFMKVIMMLFKLCGCKKIFVYFKKKPTSAPSSPTKNSGSRSSISTSAPNSQVRTIESESVPDISKVSQVAPVETSVLSDLPLLSSSVDALDRLHTADSLEDGAKVSWSGKILNPKESRKYFEILTDSTTELPGVDLVKELPHQFIVTKNDDAVDQSDATSETVRTEKTKEVSSRQAESL